MHAGLTLSLLGGAVSPFFPVSLEQATFEDLEFLRPRLANVQVVQLGEATHGGSEFYRLKFRLVRFLHERLGYDLLVLESGLIETDLANLKREHLTPDEWLDSTLFGNFRWMETQALFRYLKGEPKLQVTGIDPQFSSDNVLALAAEVVEPYDSEFAKEIRTRLGEGYGFRGLTQEREKFRAKRDAFLAWLKSAQTKLRSIKVSALDTPKFSILEEGLKGLTEFWNFEPDAPMMDQLGRRDRMMAEAALRRIGRRKAIVWAHNGHIGKGLGYKIVGDYLREKLASKTYALGLFGREGSYYQHWTRTTQPWQSDPAGLEAMFPKVGEAHFAHASEFKSAVKAFEPENGGLLEFIPADRFQGLIVVNSISLPKRRSP